MEPPFTNQKIKKNMKKLSYLFTFLTIVLVGCDTDKGDESYMDNRATIAGITESSSTLFATADGENTYTLKINVSKVLESNMDLTIAIDETSEAIEGVDFNLSESSINIAAGSFSGSIDIVADFDNASFDGKKLKLNLVVPDGVLVGEGSSITIDIVKSCPLPSELASSYTANPFAFDLDAPEFTASFTRVGTTGLTYEVNSGWGPNFVGWATGDPDYNGAFIYPCELTVNADGTVTVSGESYYTGGTGTYDACTGVISVTLTQAVFTNPFTVDVTFTP